MNEMKRLERQYGKLPAEMQRAVNRVRVKRKIGSILIPIATSLIGAGAVLAFHLYLHHGGL